MGKLIYFEDFLSNKRKDDQSFSNKNSSMISDLKLMHKRVFNPSNNLAENEYYDSGYSIDELRTLANPYDLVLGDRFTEDYFFDHAGKVDLGNLSEFSCDFFKYFIGQSYFDKSEIEDIEIPEIKSPDYLINGDIYIRGFSPVALIGCLDSMKEDDFSPTHGLKYNLNYSLYSGLLPPSIFNSIIDSFSDYFELKKQADMFSKLFTATDQNSYSEFNDSDLNDEIGNLIFLNRNLKINKK